VTLRVLIVAENVSLTKSGETSLGYYYLAGYLRHGIDAYAICHARCREELRCSLSAELFSRLRFVDEHWIQKLLWSLSDLLPYRVADLILGLLIHLVTQVSMRSAVRRVVYENGIDAVHQVAPISPTVPSAMFRVNAPVVIGPMCGGLDLPKGFRHLDGNGVSWSIEIGRRLANIGHYVLRGKLEAAALIVGNQRTARSLPGRVSAPIYEVVESGVDLSRLTPKEYEKSAAGAPVKFLFCGRLVDWKGAQYLIDAFIPLARDGGVHLDIIGDGPLRGQLESKIRSAKAEDWIQMHGTVPLESFIQKLRDSDVYVMPSLRECGGLAVLEAMAVGLPIVACNWMGPSEYLNENCAILVEPDSETALVEGFTHGMRRLAASPSLRKRMGESARARVCSGLFGWDAKVSRVIQILHAALPRAQKH
jgi:glycosyltransferase involved in cell wall biosynthesis